MVSSYAAPVCWNLDTYHSNRLRPWQNIFREFLLKLRTVIRISASCSFADKCSCLSKCTNGVYLKSKPTRVRRAVWTVFECWIYADSASYKLCAFTRARRHQGFRLHHLSVRTLDHKRASFLLVVRRPKISRFADKDKPTRRGLHVRSFCRGTSVCFNGMVFLASTSIDVHGGWRWRCDSEG